MFKRSSILTVHLFILPVEARKVARWLWVRKGLGDKNTTYLKLTLPVTTVKLPGKLYVLIKYITLNCFQELFSCTTVVLSLVHLRRLPRSRGIFPFQAHGAWKYIECLSRF